jgi:hypothetical protein
VDVANGLSAVDFFGTLCDDDIVKSLAGDFKSKDSGDFGDLVRGETKGLLKVRKPHSLVRRALWHASSVIWTLLDSK